MESSPTNVHKVGKDLLKAFYKLFCLQFCFLNWSVKRHWKVKILQGILEFLLNENNCTCNTYKFSYKFTFIPLCVPSLKPKARIQFSASWWSGDEKYLCFLIIVSCTLLQGCPKLKRLLLMDFLTCYHCSYYASKSLGGGISSCPRCCEMLSVVLLLIQEVLP